MSKRIFALLPFLLASTIQLAAFPGWLDSPTRDNRHDPKSPYHLEIAAPRPEIKGLVAAAVSQSVWRVRAAGPAYTDSQGNLWSADQNFSGGTAAAPSTAGVSKALPGAADQGLYQYQRYGPSFSYSFAVPAGSYQVTLKFAETYFTTAGARQFNVSINGAAVLTNFDIFASAGGSNIALDRVYNNIAPSNGVITINFGPAAINNAEIQAIQIIPQASPTNTATPTITPTPTPAGQPVWRVHAAGPAYTDSLGHLWAADQNFSGGTVAGASTAPVSGALPGAADQSLYQNQRYGTAFSYSFAVPAGSYQVTLKFAETYFTAAGLRQFNVSINGATVLTNFDIFASAGGSNIALDKVYNNIAPSGGVITLNFGPAAINNAGIQAIQIIPQPSPTSTATPTVTLTPTITLTPTLTPSPTPVGQPVWRVHAAGPAYTDSLGHLWAADQNFSGGTVAGASTAPVTGALPGAADQSLYQNQRYGTAFSYSFAVPAGSYQVTLKFAETYFTAAGLRQFNVAINGATVLTNFDIFASAGGANIALDKVYSNIAPSGGLITINFGPAAINNAEIQAIQIVPQPSPTSTVTPTASFTSTATAAITSTDTATVTAITSATFTATVTATRTATATATDTATVTGTATATPTSTATGTSTSTSTASPTSSSTLTVTPTRTVTQTFTPSRTPTPVPGGGSRLVGYLPDYDGNFATFAHSLSFTKMTHLNLAFVNPPKCSGACTGSSSMSFGLGQSDADIATLVNAAHAAGVKVLASIGGAGGDALIIQFYNAGLSSQLVASLNTYVTQHNLDGVDLDIEDPNNVGANYSTFTNAVIATFHPQGKLVTAAVAQYIQGSMATSTLLQFDFVNVMNYSNLTDAQNALAYFASLGEPRSKITLGVPFFGQSANGATEEAYSAIVAAYPNAGASNSVSGGSLDGGLAFNYVGNAAMAQETQLGVQYGGVMIWELSQDAPAPNSLLSIIQANLPAANQTPTATPTRTPSPTATAVVAKSVWRVIPGGGAYTDSLGNAWLADQNFSGGTPAGPATATVSGALPGPADQALYHSQRYGTAFSYSFAVPAGSYQVTLKFAETYFTAAGQRQFNVSINGATVLTNFDIVAAAGGANIAVDKVYSNIAPSGGLITINFGPAAVDNAEIQAIQVIPQPSGTATFTPTVACPAPAPNFGPNVLIFDPGMSSASIQSQIDSVYSQQAGNQFGSARYALLFKPGTYNNTVSVGYYTQALGLGSSPDSVLINGGVVSNAALPNGNATCNFWQGAENLAVAPSGGTDKWAVSQACPLRRMHIKGGLVLSDTGSTNWSSGGFLGDSLIDGQVNSGTQQQWLSRNSQWGSWAGSNWNMVFVGDNNAPSGATWPNPPHTVVNQTPLSREKPFLQIDSCGNYSVFVPALATNSQGPTWTGGAQAGQAIPLSQFYIARSAVDSSATMNAALAAGKNLLITPGIYNLTAPLNITNANTVVLGLGIATLLAQNGTTAMTVADVDGVKIAGLLFDAGATSSPILLQVGPVGSSASHAANPSSLSDLFFRVGGAAVGKAALCLQINSNDVIGDDFWIWRADHSNGVGWTSNTADTGLVVNGANVTIYGLSPEHFQKFQTLWNGNGGRVYFYQSEEPYDVPNQAAWMNGSENGYPSYKVADTVTSHQAYGIGVYCYFSTNSAVALANAIEVPQAGLNGAMFHNMTTISLGGVGTISAIIDGWGNAVNTASQRSTLSQ